MKWNRFKSPWSKCDDDWQYDMKPHVACPELFSHSRFYVVKVEIGICWAVLRNCLSESLISFT